MKLPNAGRAVVPGRKITHYLLSTTHKDGQHKAAFFRGFGFTSEDWPAFASALLQHARTYEVVEITPTPFGQNYFVEGPLPTPDGRDPPPGCGGASLDCYDYSPNPAASWFHSGRR